MMALAASAQVSGRVGDRELNGVLARAAVVLSAWPAGRAVRLAVAPRLPADPGRVIDPAACALTSWAPPPTVGEYWHHCRSGQREHLISRRDVAAPGPLAGPGLTAGVAGMLGALAGVLAGSPARPAVRLVAGDPADPATLAGLPGSGGPHPGVLAAAGLGVAGRLAAVLAGARATRRAACLPGAVSPARAAALPLPGPPGVPGGLPASLPVAAGRGLARYHDRDGLAAAYAARPATLVWEDLGSLADDWYTLAAARLADLTGSEVICGMYQSARGDSGLGPHAGAETGVIFQARGSQRWTVWDAPGGGCRHVTTWAGDVLALPAGIRHDTATPARSACLVFSLLPAAARAGASDGSAR